MSSGEFKLKLIVQASADSPGPFLGEISGRNWTIAEFQGGDVIPSFTCISYAWGPDTDREENPFYPAVGPSKISIHTIPSLQSVIHAFQSQTPAFWVDAFCLPAPDSSQPGAVKNTAAILESMGYIYQTAMQVSVVLSRDTFAAIKLMVTLNTPQEEADSSQEPTPNIELKMDCLENDLWIQSIWAYQEVMGSRRLNFLSESVDSPPVDLEDSLNAIGYFARNDFESLRLYPCLDGFLTLGGEWMIGGDNYALRVMANLDRKQPRDTKAYWYARISALTTEMTTQIAELDDDGLAEKFMETCERLHDFSFIFSAAERESERDAQILGRETRGWRPRPGKLPAIIMQITAGGSAQQGRLLEDGTLELDQVATYSAGAQTLSAETITWFRQMIEQIPYLLKETSLTSLNMDEHTIAFASRKVLEVSGPYTGSTEYSVGPYASALVIVSTVIWYTFGAPGLVRIEGEDGKLAYIPGILVGKIEERRSKGESIGLR